MNNISLLKDADNGLITIGVGQSYATVPVGEWSKILSAPRMYRRPEGVPYVAPNEDCA